jgi:allantoicase
MDFRSLTDLASRRFGAGVVYANDEFFAEKENLLNEKRPDFNSHTFGHKGQIYDGWETRRRRDAGHDSAIVRLGAAGIIKGVVIDTLHFTGNYPEFASVEACAVEGHPSVEELQNATWHTILNKSALQGDTENLFEISDPHRWTHLRLSIYPDGGVSRLRVHGVVVPDPRWILATGVIDLAGLENGGDILASSDNFYSSSRNTLLPGLPRTQGDGWENRRRRGDGNDWFAVSLACEGIVSAIEVDTTHFKGNAPGWISVSAGGDLTQGTGSQLLVNKIAVQPDTRHRFIVPTGTPVNQVRLDVFPDGGLGRFRVFGRPTDDALKAMVATFLETLPADHRASIDESSLKLS